MAYVSKEDKARLAPGIKAVLKKYGMKGTIAVDNHSTLVVNIKSGKLDLLGDTDHHQINTYWCAEWARKSGKDEIANFYEELISAMKGDQYFDHSDSMTDYFHCSHYIDINAGKWNKPYILEA